MARTKMTLKERVEWNYRQTILKAKKMRHRNEILLVDHMNDLQCLNPQIAPDGDGKIEFEAQAEIFFTTNEGHPNYSSTGQRLKFAGTIIKKGANFVLEEPVILKDTISTTNLLKDGNC